MKANIKPDRLNVPPKPEESEMIKLEKCVVSSAYEDAYVSDTWCTPERKILTAVMERAILDLMLVNKHDTSRVVQKEAIRWVLSSEDEVAGAFTFNQVIDFLEISDHTIFLIKTVARSMKYHQGKYYEEYTRRRPRCKRRLCRYH